MSYDFIARAMICTKRVTLCHTCRAGRFPSKGTTNLRATPVIPTRSGSKAWHSKFEGLTLGCQDWVHTPPDVVRVALPSAELRSLRSLRPLPMSSSSSLRDNLLPSGPSPFPCPGVGKSASWQLYANAVLAPVKRYNTIRPWLRTNGVPRMAKSACGSFAGRWPSGFGHDKKPGRNNKGHEKSQAGRHYDGENQ